MRSRINKWECIQLKKLLYSKGNITSIKKQLMQWEKIFASYSTEKGLKYIIYNDLQKKKTPKESTLILALLICN
jgi:hypothetical protein